MKHVSAHLDGYPVNDTVLYCANLPSSYTACKRDKKRRVDESSGVKVLGYRVLKLVSQTLNPIILKRSHQWAASSSAQQGPGTGILFTLISKGSEERAFEELGRAGRHEARRDDGARQAGAAESYQEALHLAEVRRGVLDIVRRRVAVHANLRGPKHGTGD